MVQQEGRASRKWICQIELNKSNINCSILLTFKIKLIMVKKIQLLALIVASAALTFTSCKKAEDGVSASQTSSDKPDVSENGQNPDEAVLTQSASGTERHSRGGYVYTESNATAQNEILVYDQHADGSLTLDATVASGGNGIGIYQGLGLDGQGALALSDNNEWLFAVNAGSNSVSSFKVHNDGSLTLAHTESSGGTVPISLCIHHHHLYVVNSSSSNICGFTVGTGGTLTVIPNSNLPLSSAMSDPAQIAFSPNGEYLYVTEKATDKICSFDVDANGVASFDQAFSSTGHTPFGFSIARDNYMVVSNANTTAPGVPVPNGASCTSYSGINPGNLNAVNGAVPDHQSAACWVSTTQYGRFAYISNTGSNNISSYYVAPWGGIYLIHGSAVSTGAGSLPKDNCVAADNYYFYVLHTGTGEIGGYHRAFLGGLVSVGNTPNLPEFATGLVAW
jgi:6-phosphogluconolactonase